MKATQFSPSPPHPLRCTKTLPPQVGRKSTSHPIFSHDPRSTFHDHLFSTRYKLHATRFFPLTTPHQHATSSPRYTKAVPLHLPPALATAIWQQAERDTPRECVGALGGVLLGAEAYARAAYPLPNIAPEPERHYLADPGALLRAFRAMQKEQFELVALYHSHPHGPAWPSVTDKQLAAYPVPYLIADLATRQLHAYALPTGAAVELVLE